MWTVMMEFSMTLTMPTVLLAIAAASYVGLWPNQFVYMAVYLYFMLSPQMGPNLNRRWCSARESDKQWGY